MCNFSETLKSLPIHFFHLFSFLWVEENYLGFNRGSRLFEHTQSDCHKKTKKPIIEWITIAIEFTSIMMTRRYLILVHLCVLFFSFESFFEICFHTFDALIIVVRSASHIHWGSKTAFLYLIENFSTYVKKKKKTLGKHSKCCSNIQR